MIKPFQNPVFAALDVATLSEAQALARSLRAHCGGLKLGLEFFSAAGSDGLRAMVDEGLPVFADLKFHDIPNTVAGAVRAISRIGVTIVNVHAAGGVAMMEAARKAAEDAAGPSRPLVIGVTVLTSLDEDDLRSVGVNSPVRDQVLRLAGLAQRAGLDGVVCSPHEITALRQAMGPSFKLIVPGLRPQGADVSDQKRVMTPEDAYRLGADVLVIGRPITAAADPARAAAQIAQSLASLAA